MKQRLYLFVSSLLLCFLFIKATPTDTNEPDEEKILQLPIAGNTYAQQVTGRSRMITNNGIENWTDKQVQFDTYLRISQPGSIKIAVKAKTDGESSLQLSINGKEKTIAVKGNTYASYNAGEWKMKDTGYVKITLRGLTKTGSQFAYVSGYEISGTAINANTAYVKNNEGNFFYWGRRGPSVHLNYPFADSIKAAWFYNEITVPQGQDVVGSYYMANGFGEGYFGIQVNSPTERRVLFSVWSPYSTDDPKSIPEDQRITMLKKGEGVYTGEFGNEGSGGQSFLRYNWKAGVTYKFLLKGKPDGAGNTIYTAYFFAPEKGEWMLIASFKRPKTNTYLRRFHSFLENFIPEQGDKERQVLFNNQWIADSAGNWIELSKAVFTYDNTAAKGYRMDYAGGVKDNAFFLKNCGFFSGYTPYRSTFTRMPQQRKPDVDLGRLP
ncbi:DUF3472 domain-containing protein [Flavisolibacter sp. BT320]|nr:DUF3472 domain-containing protein [Flavisolibacter longurius]